LAITADSVTNTSNKIGNAVGHFDAIASSANAFFTQGTDTMSGIKGTSTKLNTMLDNPAFSSDLKQSASDLRKGIEKISEAMHELNGTMQDKEIRGDILAMLNRLNQSTENIAKSMQTVDKLANDQGLRSDIKEAVANAKDAVDKADRILGTADVKQDITSTLAKIKSAATNVDIASQQLSGILGKRAPLFHMMFGKPGVVPNNQEMQAKTDKSSEAKSGSQQANIPDVTTK
jgi:hypothetical protein